MPKTKGENHIYTYNGSVKVFDDIVSSNWKGKTIAPSEAKARSNLIFQWKREHGRVAATRVTLPGEINRIN